MNELELKVNEIMPNIGILATALIKNFIEKCSLSEFEILKDLEYDLNQKDNE